MQPEVRKHLYDMLQAASRLAEFTQGKTFEQYLEDSLLRSAVERQLGILGEALNRARRTDSETADRVRDARRIIAFRNLLVHGYDIVDDRLVWGILEAYLPGLSEDVRRLLSESGELEA